MSNLQYLSQTNLAMIGRDMQLLSYNQLINNINELADGLHDLIALVSLKFYAGSWWIHSPEECVIVWKTI